MYHAVFVRQEGVILRARSDAREEGYLPEFLPGAKQALKSLADSGLCVVVMVPQPHASQWTEAGHTPAGACSYIAEAVGADRDQIDCVHWEVASSGRRGAWRGGDIELLWPAARERGIDPSMSYFVGDTVSDMEVGRLMGCRERYLVLTGRGRHELARCWLHGEQGFRVAFDLKAAAGEILLREQGPIAQPVPSTLREITTR